MAIAPLGGYREASSVVEMRMPPDEEVICRTSSFGHTFATVYISFRKADVESIRTSRSQAAEIAEKKPARASFDSGKTTEQIFWRPCRTWLVATETRYACSSRSTRQVPIMVAHGTSWLDRSVSTVQF